jgi:hypothetical protein
MDHYRPIWIVEIVQDRQMLARYHFSIIILIGWLSSPVVKYHLQWLIIIS